MDHFKHCPMPVKGGGDCWSSPHPASRFGLCAQHWRDVVQDWVDDTPETTRRCLKCGVLNQYDSADWASARCSGCGTNVDAPWILAEHHEREEVLAAARAIPRGVVYYLRFAGLVKIGFTESFDARMTAIPHDEVLAAEPGDYQLEKRRHKEFQRYLASGREWFHSAQELIDFTASVRANHGDPELLARSIESAHAGLSLYEEHGGAERLTEATS